MYPLGARGSISGPLGHSPVSTAAAGWWLSGGISAANCVVAYAAKGAASLAASYNNLAAPGNGLPDGTYDATVLGVAPTWDAANGWKGGISIALSTQYTPLDYINHSYFVVFSSANNDGYTFGLVNNTNNRYIGIVPAFATLGGRTYLNGAYKTAGIVTQSGSMALAGAKVYLNGSPDGDDISIPSYDPAIPVLSILARNTVNGVNFFNFTGYVKYFAAYKNTTITAPQVAALHAATA